jgi:hypothetical protein
MSLTIPFVSRRDRTRPKHRADDRIRDLEARHATEMAKLREENVALLNRQAAADDFFMLQDNYLTGLEAELAAERQARAEAEGAVSQLEVDCAGLRDEVLMYRARFGAQLAAEANANRITVPPMQRIGADQDTGTFDVTTLWQAADAGLLGPDADPGAVHGH